MESAWAIHRLAPGILIRYGWDMENWNGKICHLSFHVVSMSNLISSENSGSMTNQKSLQSKPLCALETVSLCHSWEEMVMITTHTHTHKNTEGKTKKPCFSYSPKHKHALRTKVAVEIHHWKNTYYKTQRSWYNVIWIFQHRNTSTSSMNLEKIP